MTLDEGTLAVAPDHGWRANAWQAWSVAKLELLYLSWALMEIALLAPLALTFMGWARFWSATLVTLWLLLLLLLPFNLARLFSAIQMKKKTQRRMMILVLLLTITVSWRLLLFDGWGMLDFSWLVLLFHNIGESSVLWTRMLTLFLLTLFTWWRGLRLVQFKPDLYSVGLRLRAGILIFVPIALLPRMWSGMWGVLPFVLLYFLAGLIAVALVRAEQVEVERSGFSASLSPRWVATIAAASLIVVAAAGLLAVLIGGDTLLLVMQWLAPVRIALLAGLSVALSTAFYLASPLLFLFNIFLVWLSNVFTALFVGLSGSLGFDTPDNLGPLNELLPTEEEAGQVVGITLPPEVTRGLIILLMLAMVVIVAYALTRRFRQAADAANDGGPIRASGGGTMAAESIGERILQRLGLFRRWRTAASIRQLYQAMCDTAASAGFMRSPSETPYEYLMTLSELWPTNQEDTRLITEAYIRVRYGEVPETKEELQAIRQAWQRLEEAESVGLQRASNL